jgi:rhamnulokinase
MVPDLFNYFLTGKKNCEFTNATTTQFFDPINKNWNKSILQAMGIPFSIFPEIIEPGTLIGNLSPWLCDELGINPIPIVSVATHDTASAVSAVPTQNPGYAFLSSGTWSLLGTEEESPVINATSLKNNFSSYGGVCGTWLIWKNIQALWLLQECMRNWAASEKRISHEDIIIMASRAKAFGPIIDTDDLAFFTPGDFPSRIAEFCQRTKQEAPEGQGAIARCILESLALKYRFTFDRLQEILGKHLDRIYTIGGGSRNWLLNKFTAEAANLTVKAGPAEASAIGNVMMQLIAMRELDCLGNCRKVVEESFESAVFEANNSDAWEEAYGRYQEIILSSKTFNQ